MNTKIYLKGIVTGVVGTTLFISTMTSVNAIESYKRAIVSFVNIVVDGKPIVLQSEPYLIENKTYLPIRDIGQVLGKKVEWDAANNTIFIGEEKKSYLPSTGIYQLDPLHGETYLQVGYGGEDYLEPEEDGGKISLYKQRFSTVNSIAFLDGGSVAFNLYDDKFHTIRGFIGVDDSNPGYSEKGIVTFYGDGKELVTLTTGTKRDEPIPFEIDIRGVEKMEIKNIKASGTASRVALVDVMLEAVQE